MNRRRNPDQRTAIWVIAVLLAGAIVGSVILAQGDTNLPLVFAPGPGPTPTDAEPPGGNLLIVGKVTVADSDPAQSVENAGVSIVSCIGKRRFEATSDASGAFGITVPGLYLDPCYEIGIEATAEGFQPHSDAVLASDLRRKPQLDIVLAAGSSPTVTPLQKDVTITGSVTLAGSSPPEPIEGIVVAAESCIEGRRFSDTSDESGAYTFVVPAEHITSCVEMVFRAHATGYATAERTVSRQDLIGELAQNLELSPESNPTDHLTVTGLVHDADGGPNSPINGAAVSFMTCTGALHQATSDGAGQFAIDLPEESLSPCANVSLEAWATGYGVHVEMIALSELRSDPQLVIALVASD